MLRSFLLYLSRQSWLRHWIETSSAADRLTSRFIAGATLERALAVCQRLNRDGILVSLDHLGESVTSLAEAERSRDAYLVALDQIAHIVQARRRTSKAGQLPPASPVATNAKDPNLLAKPAH